MTQSDKYLVWGETQDGYYVEIIMMMLSGCFNGSFKAKIHKHGISFYEHNNSLMINVSIKGFDYYNVDPSQIDRELIVESTKKNHQLSNNKKKDGAMLYITRDQPDRLVLQINDSGGMIAMPIEYIIKNVEDDIQPYIVPNLKHVNPTIIIDSSEMTKSVKIIVKASAKEVRIEFQKNAMRFVSMDEATGKSSNIDLGKWDSSAPSQHHIINKEAFKAVMKFYNLGKRIRIHVTEDSYCISTAMSSNLGVGTIVFCSVNK
jgi:hypothetical protein